MPMTLDQLIPKIDKALSIVAARSKNLNLTLLEAEVELSVHSASGGEGGVKVDFVVEVDIGGSGEKASDQRLSLKLTPKGGQKELGEPETDALVSGILAVAGAVHRAGLSSFAVSEAKVEVEFEITKEGKLKAIVGGFDKSSKNSHKITLTFRPTN
jgi:hypothetical protein